MSELASAFPTAGGIYYWASKLGGPGWGWFTGWFNLIGLVAVVASVDYVVRQLPDEPARPLQRSLHLQLRQGLGRTFTTPRTSISRCSRSSCILHGADQRLLQPSGFAVQRGLGLVARHRRGGDRRDPVAVRATTRASRSCSATGSTTRASATTCTGLRAAARVPADDVHDHRLRRLGPRLRGDPRRRRVGPQGSLAFGLLFGRDRLDRPAGHHLRRPEEQVSRSRTAASRPWPSSTTALSSAAAKAVILISTIGQLFCGMACVTSASRMTFAFSRDGAVPGHNLWRRLGKNSTPTWAVLFVVPVRADHHHPGLLPERQRAPVAFLAVTSISVIGLYIAYTIPVFLRWRMGDAFEPGPWTLGRQVPLDQPDRLRLGGALRDHLLPAVHAGRRVLQSTASAGRRSTTPRSSRSR